MHMSGHFYCVYNGDCEWRGQILVGRGRGNYRLGEGQGWKNATFPWNMVKNCIKNVNYFTNFRFFCKKKTEIYI